MLKRLIFFVFLLFPVICFSQDAQKSDPFTLTTTDFLDTGIMASTYTCTGKDISPNLSWDHAPDKTKSLTLLVSDESIKEKFYHWVVYNISPKIKNLQQGKALQKEIKVGKNSFENQKYNGPCPPLGQSHSYVFTLYALDTVLPVEKTLDGNQVEEAMQQHILAKSELRGVFSRWYR